MCAQNLTMHLIKKKYSCVCSSVYEKESDIETQEGSKITLLLTNSAELNSFDSDLVFVSKNYLF